MFPNASERNNEVISELKSVREPYERISGGPYCFVVDVLQGDPKKGTFFDFFKFLIFAKPLTKLLKKWKYLYEK
jgi:hypothetical protein